MGTPAAEGVQYPRDVPVEPGMPPGWKGIEKLYGAAAKSAGTTYTRYFSLDGKHRNVCTVKQVIQLHCADNGGNPDQMHQEYVRLQKERKQRESDERRIEREARGKLEGVQREEAIARFRDTFGPLTGPLVYCFPRWITRWHFQPGCEQVMVEYLDTEGHSWKLLKDLECAFQHKIDVGEGEHITQLIKTAREKMDPAAFSLGPKKARENQGVYESSPESGESRVLTQEERLEERKQREEKRRSTDHHSSKRSRLGHLVLNPGGPKQDGWAALETLEDVQQAFRHFRDLLVHRGFQSNVELVAVHGVAPKRRYSRRIRGVYFQMPELLAGQRCYQKLLHFPQLPAKVGCDCIYLLWSELRSRWEIATDLAEVRPVVAHSAQAPGPVTKAPGPWQIQEGLADFSEDQGLVILESGVGTNAAG